MNNDIKEGEEINELKKEIESLYNCAVNLYKIIAENGFKIPDKDKNLLLKTFKKLSR